MSRLFTSASSQYMENDSTAVVSNGTTWTWSMWVYPTQSGTAGTMMSVAASGNTTDYYRLDQSAGNALRFRAAGTGSGTSDASTANTFTTNGWNHALCTHASNTDRKCYLNNGTAGTNTTSRNPSMNRTALGCQDSSTRSQFFQGRVAEVGVWNVVLGAEEITALNAGVSPLLIRPTALTNYWPVIGQYSPEIDIRGAVNLTAGASSPTTADHCRILYPIGPSVFQIPAIAPPVGRVPTLMLMGVG